MNNRTEIPPIITTEPYQGCSVVALSNVGCVRDENQDFMGYVRMPDAQVLIVADGMGGHSGGFEASRIVVSAIKQRCSQAADIPPIALLEQSLFHAHGLVRQASASDPKLDGMGSTVVVAYIRDRQLWLAHVGDSRAYLIRDGRCQQLTVDHTRVNRMVAEGMIRPEEALDHPMGHILERSLGATEQVEPEVQPTPLPLRPGDRILLCSDGFTGRVKNDEIADLFASPNLESATQGALQLALDRQADDNTTVAVVEVVGGKRRKTPPPGKPKAGAKLSRDALYLGVILVLCALVLLLSLAALYGFKDELSNAFGQQSVATQPAESGGSQAPSAETTAPSSSGQDDQSEKLKGQGGGNHSSNNTSPPDSRGGKAPADEDKKKPESEGGNGGGGNNDDTESASNSTVEGQEQEKDGSESTTETPSSPNPPAPKEPEPSQTPSSPSTPQGPSPPGGTGSETTPTDGRSGSDPSKGKRGR